MAAAITQGVPTTFTVTAENTFGNVATAYAGTVHFTSSDTQAVLPANATLTNGVGIFSATFNTTGSQMLTAADSVTPTIVGTSAAISVNPPGAATHFVLNSPTSAVAGALVAITITALDVNNNPATSFGGAAQVSSSDGQATLPNIVTMTKGSGSFFVTLGTVGIQTVSVTADVSSGITGTTNITVNPAATSRFALTVASTSTAPGVPFSVTVLGKTNTAMRLRRMSARCA